MKNPSQLSDIDPASYAPYRDPRDYILSWTDEIWIDLGLGRLGEHYDRNIKVHTAYGETYDFDHVLANSIQKMSAFPNGGGGSGEDVIWEQRGDNGFISSHRVLKTGTHTGFWTYGPPTGKDWISRTIAHCTVENGKVVEEWLVRDEWAVLQSLGLDPLAIATNLARASPVTGEKVDIGSSAAFAGSYDNPTAKGISGPRPDRYGAECDMIKAMFDEVWNGRLFNRVPAYCDPRVVCHTTRMHRVQTVPGYQQSIIDFLAIFPDGKVELRDLVVNESPDLGLRIAAIWVLHGTYSGVPFYGPPTHTPVKVLGASHYELRHGRILREWRIYDEIAVLTQIMQARLAAGET